MERGHHYLYTFNMNMITSIFVDYINAVIMQTDEGRTFLGVHFYTPSVPINKIALDKT
jgi:hypothetical protein